MSFKPLLLITCLSCLCTFSLASGRLTIQRSDAEPVRILNHDVVVTIHGSHARTEVVQSFFNQNDEDLDAIYSFPVPKGASLSEFAITIDGVERNGEVLEKQEARRIQQEERAAGNDTGLAEQDGFRHFHFSVAPVRSQQETKVRFVYYQAIEIDTGVGRFLYPLSDADADDRAADNFWNGTSEVDGRLSFEVNIHSNWPIEAMRIPGHESKTEITYPQPDVYRTRMELSDAKLHDDLVFYYRLAENLPGRVEVVPYRASTDEDGTFMAIVTPGIDLAPLDDGADYVFLLDVSGSMAQKMQTLSLSVQRAIKNLNSDDRIRLVSFESKSKDLTGWLSASEESIEKAVKALNGLRADGGTNLFAGFKKVMKDVDPTRATSVVLITDAEANEGELNPRVFEDFLKRTDVRVFGYLLGNGNDWELMEAICDGSGGTWSSISNSDDLVGQVMLAKNKVTHEAMHDVSLTINGVEVNNTTENFQRKIFYGQQMVIFGRYAEPGLATLTMKTRITGEDHEYSTTFEFPAIDRRFPELERLWAKNMIDDIKVQQRTERISEKVAKKAITALGLEYQLVTDHTSMLVLDDAAFERHGIDRKNLERIARESQAAVDRTAEGVTSHRVDASQPMFDNHAPSIKPKRRSSGGGTGGGSFDPISGLFALLSACLALTVLRRDKGN